MQRMKRTHRLAASVVASLLLFAACSGGGGGNDDVASLSGDGDQAADAGTTGDGEQAITEEAALEFAECMRENGVEDFPDPVVDADGNVNFGFGPGGGGDDEGPAFDVEAAGAAQEVCSELLEGFALGGGGGGFADNPELQDALVGYTDCLRDEGLDVGDLEIGQGGQDGQAPGDGQGPRGGAQGGGGGQGQGGGQGGQPQGDGQGPGGFIANALGLDPEDPEVEAALETCQPHLDEAFSQFGPGAED